MEEHNRRATDNQSYWVVWFMLGILVGVFLLGIKLWYHEQDNTFYRAKAIELGCAHYSSTTGKFVWKEK